MSKIKKISAPEILGGDCIYVLFTYSISNLEGQLLTYLEAILTDPVQRKAAKDIIRPLIWEWAMRMDMSKSFEIKRLIDGVIVTNEVTNPDGVFAVK